MNRTQIDPGPGPAAIRHVRPADRAALADFFTGLSVRARTLRFFAPVRPGQAMLRRLAGEDSGIEALVATCGGAIIGHAMAVDRPGPRGSQVADIGVVVGDAWQGQGVGSALMRGLSASAQARGVTSLAMDVLPENRRVLAMIAAHWDLAATERGAGCITIRVPLPPQQQQRPAA